MFTPDIAVSDKTLRLKESGGDMVMIEKRRVCCRIESVLQTVGRSNQAPNQPDIQPTIQATKHLSSKYLLTNITILQLEKTDGRSNQRNNQLYG